MALPQRTSDRRRGRGFGVLAIVVGLGFRGAAFDQPAIISVPAAFLSAFVVSKLTWEGQADEIRDALGYAFRALHVAERQPVPVFVSESEAETAAG